MASNGPTYLSERQDIHKSCKSLENLLAVLNDYCEAAGAVVALQKTLAKALKETAGMKVVGEIATNAMMTSAGIFEGLSEIDSKFAKIADKEYDSISADVRKWFKKLAKEEKTHDEKIATMNARIKQAGQIYEKRAKKNARDASDEHSRYINLISSLGPEISQEKHDHAVQVTERHTITTFSVAASLSRIADSEWHRSCEQVRRFAPVIGHLGHWRVLCEGQWSKSVPQDLPDIDARPLVADSTGRADPSRDQRFEGDTLRSPGGQDSDGQSTAVNTVANRENEKPSTHPYLKQAPSSYNNPQGSDLQFSQSSQPSRPPSSLDQQDSDGRHTSLTSFPSPPQHFPIPALPTHAPSQPSRQPTTEQASSSTSSGPVQTPLPSLTESPRDEEENPFERSLHSSQEQSTTSRSPGSSPSMPVATPREIVSPRPANLAATLSLSPTSRKGDYSAQGDYLQDEREFGVMDKSLNDRTRSKTLDSSTRMERTDTGGSVGSVVAAMRNRLSQQPIAPPPKDVPRLPLSVNDLANRYQPMEEPSSPRQATSPVLVRSIVLPSVDTGSRYPAAASPPGIAAYRQQLQLKQQQQQQQLQQQQQQLSPQSTSPSTMEDMAMVEANRRRRQKLDEMAEQEEMDREQKLQERERELDARSRELDSERARLQVNKAGVGAYDRQDMQGRSSQDFPSRNNARPASVVSAGQGQSRNSFSPTHLSPPSGSQQQQQPQQLGQQGQYRPRNNSTYSQSQAPSSYSQTSSQPPSPSQPRVPGRGVPGHSPSCGCEACSVAHYKSPSPQPSQHDLRPPEKPINLRPEKPKNWIRRLSMPVAVGNAFSLDGRKISPASQKSPGPAGGAGEDGRLEGMRGKNPSMTSFNGRK